jgi:hypothetical protein
MLSLIEDIDHPENVDISILSKLHSDPVRVRWWNSSAVRMAIISLLVLTIIVALAFTLQYLKQ